MNKYKKLNTFDNILFRVLKYKLIKISLSYLVLFMNKNILGDIMEKETISEQNITLINRKKLMITGVEKMISVKPDLLQLSTKLGNLQIIGSLMEVSKLDLDAHLVEVNGNISIIKYLDDKKTPLLKRIFK